MGPIEDVAQALAAHVGVDLRGGEVLVTEELLHAAQVGAAVEQVGGEGVAQRVRMGGLEGAAIDHSSDVARRERAVPAG
jgi:hypothetical protein